MTSSARAPDARRLAHCGQRQRCNRAAVEELCRDRGATGRNLKDKIADLTDRGIPADVVRDLDEARTLGDWSLHLPGPAAGYRPHCADR